MKKAAKAVGEKSVELIHVKDIYQITGYIRGGCTPIGMKKNYPSVLHSSIMDHETVIISGGRLGSQIEITPADLVRVLRAKVADITADTP